MSDTPRFSDDPIQQAEMAAQYHFERRITGEYARDYEPEEDYDDHDGYDGDEEQYDEEQYGDPVDDLPDDDDY